MYFVPLGLFIAQLDPAFVKATGLGTQARDLTWLGFFIHNLVPVSLGNMIGGSVLVGTAYWFVYLRPIRRNAERAASTR